MRLSFAILAIATLMAGCIGSPRKRNPMFSRRDKGPGLTVEKLRKKYVYQRPDSFETERVLFDAPENSWFAHDRDVYRVIGKDKAEKIIPTPKWFDPTATPEDD